MANEEEIEIKNLCPMIAMISAGKTSLLKVLFNIDILESSSGIGTKFVTIIRFNPGLMDERKYEFYQLKIINKGNDIYNFSKILNSKVIGSSKIKEKIVSLNKELKEKDLAYDQLFYFLEIGNENFIEDKEYLKNYDLVDVPGVSEYRVQEKTQEGNSTEKPEDDLEQAPINSTSLEANQEDLGAPYASFLFQKKSFPEKSSTTIEDEMKKYDPKKEKNYLTEIFKIIGNKMKNGIFVFNIENYQLKENYLIIGKLQKIINKPIENFLLILNKIDISENRDYDLNVLATKIIEYFPNADIFNFTKNTIVPCSTFQLENELKMEKSFINLIYYHFLNFFMNIKKEFNNTMTPNTNITTFMDYLKKLIINLNKNIKKQTFYEEIKKVINKKKECGQFLKDIKEIIQKIKDKYQDINFSLGIRHDDFEVGEIEKTKNILEKDKEEEEEDEEDISAQSNIMILLYYYSKYLDKKQIPPKSKDTEEIIKYFTMENMEKNKKVEADIIKELESRVEKEKSYSNKIDDISNKLKKFYDSYEKEGGSSINLNSLGIYINSSIGILKSSKMFFIPLLGVSNAGKSTVLNCMIGTSILPTRRNECTRKGILIRHWNKDYSIIRKAKFVKETMYTGNNIYSFISQDKIIAKGEKDIKKILEGANGKYVDKEEDFFYEMNIKIKFIDDLKISDQLKEKICFIDLPGFGTNNPFEDKDTYSHLILSCNLFLFVVFNLKILENDNYKMLNNLYKKMAEYRKIPTQAFINKCLFIINVDKSQIIIIFH